MISDEFPPEDTREVCLGAKLIRHLVLDGCNACRLPETGLRVKGALIVGGDERGKSIEILLCPAQEFEIRRLHPVTPHPLPH